MKNMILIFLALLFTTSYNSPTGEITVTVNNINLKEGGLISVGVFVKEGFPYSEKAVAGKIVKVKSNPQTIKIKDITPGTYALAIYQDLNSDGKLNTNFIGIPSEPAAFSNNKMGRMGPPDFEEVCFKVDSNKNVKLSINLID